MNLHWHIFQSASWQDIVWISTNRDVTNLNVDNDVILFNINLDKNEKLTAVTMKQSFAVIQTSKALKRKIGWSIENFASLLSSLHFFNRLLSSLKGEVQISQTEIPEIFGVTMMRYVLAFVLSAYFLSLYFDSAEAVFGDYENFPGFIEMRAGMVKWMQKWQSWRKNLSEMYGVDSWMKRLAQAVRHLHTLIGYESLLLPTK